MYLVRQRSEQVSCLIKWDSCEQSLAKEKLRIHHIFTALKRHISTIYGLMTDRHNDKLSVGPIAQRIKHCTGIVDLEVRVRVPLRPEFYRPYIHCCSSSIINLFLDRISME